MQLFSQHFISGVVGLPASSSKSSKVKAYWWKSPSSRRTDRRGKALAESSRAENNKQSPGEDRDPRLRIGGVELATLFGALR